ncbi:MAG: carboxypeptidase-like regulatory domain-containing protein, partial [Bacteroidota bacterium]
MKKSIKSFLLVTIMVLMSSAIVWAQSNVVSGNVKSGAGDPLVGVNIVVIGTVLGTISDIDGNFSFTVHEDYPITLKITMVGYESKEIEVTESNASSVDITLSEQTIMGQEVVISASRVEESILESPVTVEKMDILAIKNTPSANFYDGIADLKGVQMNTSSMTFKAVNTRGFATMSNTRFVQLIDGMDNAAPGLNFPMGNIIGIGDLDVEGVELVPGAASALYGPNAFNGILLITSKSPFDYQGLSVMAKGGITQQGSYNQGEHFRDQDAAGINPFYDFSLRYAKTFNNKFAFKVNFSYLQALDWYAADYSQHAEEAPGDYNTNVNGVNIYGDAIATTLNFDDLAGAPPGTFGSEKVARTGYK